MKATVTDSAHSLVAATSGASGGYPNKNGIQLVADPNNTASISFGKANTVTTSGNTTAGVPLAPGQSVCVPPVYALDASKIFVISGTTGQTLYWELIES